MSTSNDFSETVKLHEVFKPVTDPNWASQMIADSQTILGESIRMNDPSNLKLLLMNRFEVNKIFFLRARAANYLSSALENMREKLDADELVVDTEKATVIHRGRILVNLAENGTLDEERRLVTGALERVTSVELGVDSIRWCVELGELHHQDKRVEAIHLLNDVLPPEVRLGKPMASVSPRNGELVII